MQAEVVSVENNNSWAFVDRPKDKNVLPGKWVYKLKYGANDQVDKYKATISFKSSWDTCGFTLNVLVHNYLL